MKAGGVVALGVLMLLAAASAEAQYRWRDAVGQVNYGDIPPTDARDLQRVDPRAPVSRTDPASALPFELRRATAQHPAVLYTSDDVPAVRQRARLPAPAWRPVLRAHRRSARKTSRRCAA